MVYDKEGKAIGLMSSEQVSKVVSGLLPEATPEKSGLMSSYKAQYTNTILSYNKNFTRYLKLAIIDNADNSSAEGLMQHVEFALIGGNNYVNIPSVHIVGGFIHQKRMEFSKTKLLGSDLLFGYVDNGTSCDIYVETIGFNHYVRIIPLSIGANAKLTNEEFTEKPAGWINL